MKDKRKGFTAFLLSAMMLVTGIAFNTTSALAEEKAPPTNIVKCEKYGLSKGFAITFNTDDESWFDAVSSVKVAGATYKKAAYSWDFEDGGSNYRLLATDRQVIIGEAFSEGTATCVISAKGYKDLKITLNRSKHTATIVTEEIEQTYKITTTATEHGTVNVNKYTAKEGDVITVTTVPDENYIFKSLTVKTADGKEIAVTNSEFKMPAADVSVMVLFEKKLEETGKAIDLKDISVSVDSFNGLWKFDFGDLNYPNSINKVAVNDTEWEAYSFTPSMGGKYRVSDGILEFAQKSYGQTAALKSGDVISIDATGYKNLAFKVSIADGKLTISDESEPGDNMQLHVRLVGSFESALVNQKGYDAISGASTNITQNKNSDASVEVALIKKGEEPEEGDWKLLSESGIRINSKGSSVNIVNDEEPAIGNDSGMAGVYSVHDGSVTLAGTPAQSGIYNISVTITDELGRTASSNTLPFRIFSGEETLKKQLIIDNCTKTADGKYMYDMEPWAIKKFTLDTSNQTVIVPEGLKAWYGSHTSGTYGELGYAVPEGATQTQTLILPKDCNLTLVNMDILSSVKIVVQDGAKLILRDSVVQGTVEVEKGGAFSMNYNDYGEGEFLNGASINGKLILKDGSTLENAKIYSNTNNIVNGSEARHNTNPVVIIEGNVTLKGQVFLRGDEAPTGTDSSTGKSYTGQIGLQVNGTLNLAKDAVLAVFGGGKDATTTNGGDAIILNGGTITGEGKLIAVGGDGYFGEGGNAVSGNGTISVADAYLEGGASISKSGTSGKAVGNQIKITGKTNRNLIDGTTGISIDYDNDTYWRDILKVPDLSLYKVEKNAPGEETEQPAKPDQPDQEIKPDQPGQSEQETKPDKESTESKKPSSSNDKQTAQKSKNRPAVETGDLINPILWAGLLLLTLIGLTVMVLWRRKEKKEAE